jgi:hypothetical protein
VVDDLASAGVHIRLDQCEGSLLALGEGLAGESVSIVYKFELSCKNSNDRTKVEAFDSQAGTRHSLDEHFACFQIKLRESSLY